VADDPDARHVSGFALHVLAPCLARGAGGRSGAGRQISALRRTRPTLHTTPIRILRRHTYRKRSL